MSHIQQQTRLKSINTQSLAEIGMAYYAKSPSQYLQKKTSFPEKRDSFDDQRKATNIIQPLAFSNRIGIKKRANNSKDVSVRSKNSYSNKGSFLNSSNSRSEIGCGYLLLKKQNQKLKAQQALLLSRLLQSQKAYDSLQKSFTEKCQQTQTLKSIINSLKNYIHRQITESSGTSSQNSLHGKPCSPNSKKSKQHKRKLSQLNSIRRVSINLNDLLNQVPEPLKKSMQTKFDSFIKKQSVQSIKGSAYQLQLYSFTEMP